MINKCVDDNHEKHCCHEKIINRFGVGACSLVTADILEVTFRVYNGHDRSTVYFHHKNHIV